MSSVMCAERRRLLQGMGLLAAFSGLAGCGFHPVYGSGGANGPAQAALAAIQVANIPGRTGQLLRQALQARFERGGTPIARQYDLYVAYGIGAEGIGIQPDSSVTRLRLLGTASWNLLGQDPKRSPVTSGSARSLDGIDFVNEQYFASDLSNEAAQRRITETIADQITLQLAAYFRERSEDGGS